MQDAIITRAEVQIKELNQWIAKLEREHLNAREEVKHLRLELVEERKKDRAITLAGARSSGSSPMVVPLGKTGSTMG